MHKLVPEGACVGQCWRMEWTEGSQSWSKLPIPPSQAIQDEPFSPLHMGLCQRKPAVLYPEEKQMNWCFSAVTAQWLGVMEVAELVHRLDEEPAAQPEHHPISLILSYVSVILSDCQRTRSRKLPGNSIVTPILTDLGMWEKPAFGWGPEEFYTALSAAYSHGTLLEGELLLLPVPVWPSCCTPSIPQPSIGLEPSSQKRLQQWNTARLASAKLPHFRATPNPQSQEEMSQKGCPGTQLHAPSCSLPHQSWNFPSSQLTAAWYVVGVS